MIAPQVLPPKRNALDALFKIAKPVIGVVHLKPLPGAPRYDGSPMRDIYAAAVADARVLAAGGIDGIIVENASDMPFCRPEDIGPETVAALTAACIAVRSAVDMPIGITCVANGVIPALAVAKAVGSRRTVATLPLGDQGGGRPHFRRCARQVRRACDHSGPHDF
jgi:predicted TIM-barrel enzyme